MLLFLYPFHGLWLKIGPLTYYITAVLDSCLFPEIQCQNNTHDLTSLSKMNIGIQISWVKTENQSIKSCGLGKIFSLSSVCLSFTLSLSFSSLLWRRGMEKRFLRDATWNCFQLEKYVSLPPATDMLAESFLNVAKAWSCWLFKLEILINYIITVCLRTDRQLPWC